MPSDCYSSYRELAAHHVAGRDYSIDLTRRASPITIVAPHGGGLELGTSEIARAIAAHHFSLYCFEAVAEDDTGILHLTSTRFDEPQAIKLIACSHTVVTIHGCADAAPVVFIGGLDRVLKRRLIEELQHAGFDAQDDNSHHAGSSPLNLCNRGKRGQGIQLEITRGLRRQMFAGMRRHAREETTPIFASFTATVRRVLQGIETEAGGQKTDGNRDAG